ncbi:protein abrupt-like [Scaptodrosophila lebanonensis]|uniref:Protein abrupt-like n=1 Tax=Drosophila lebanonensis TaxID=7225 RepID=A0A6J2U7N3_DROLE|nr:protein abrupt-like [Scaptodrosophila lebanonensis]
MTESTQLQTTENNNAGVVKMEPPPSTTSSTSSVSASLAAATASGGTGCSGSGSGTGAGAALSPNLEQHQRSTFLQSPLPSLPQQHYALKWNDFQTSILNSFRHLRDEEDFVDVTLACDERSFTAHKVVLSACSPYFRQLLKSNPCEHPIVILRDVRSDDVENLLSFMYNGEVNISHEQLPDFLKTAHLLQIRGLADVNGGYPFDALSTTAKALAAPLTHNNNNNNNNTNSSNNNKVNYLPGALFNASSRSNNNVSASNHNSQSSPFSTGQTPIVPATASSGAAATASSLPLTSSSSSNKSSNNSSSQVSGNTSGPPAVQELKASAPSPASSNHWDLGDMEGNRKSHLTPPPQKRIKSADLFRAQHGISPERLLLDREFPVAGQHPLTRNRSRDVSKDRDRSLELRESLLGQALENSNGQQSSQKHDLGQSAGEDSNSSDTEPSDRGDVHHDGTMDGMDNQRSHSFPSAFLGLQGIPGLLPGPSGMGANDFGTFINATNIKEEITNANDDDMQEKAHGADPHQDRDRDSAECTLAKLIYRPQLPQHFEQRSNNNNTTLNKGRSANSSPTPSARSWNDSEVEDNFGEDRFSSASSAISLTVKTTRPDCESTLYQTLLRKQEQHQKAHNLQQQPLQQQPPHPQQPSQQITPLPRQQSRNDSGNSAPVGGSVNASGSSASNYMLPCPLCETPLEQRVFRQHLDRHYPRDSPVCPVIECGRRFAHPNSVRNHMRIKHTLQWAKMKAMRSSGGPFSGGPDFK